MRLICDGITCSDISFRVTKEQVIVTTLAGAGVGRTRRNGTLALTTGLAELKAAPSFGIPERVTFVQE